MSSSTDRPSAIPHPRAPEEPAPLGETSEETVAQLTARLKNLRTQRLRDEAEAAQLDTVLRAVLLSRCDRDGGSSPTLAEHRAHLERIWAELEQLMSTTARVAVRLHLRDSDPDDPLARRAQRAIRQSQQALAAFAEAVNQA